MNSPLTTVQALRPFIEGKTVCDLGCGDGEFLTEVSKYAKVNGIENNRVAYELSKSKGLDVTFGNLRDEAWPVADVYYSYPLFHDVPIMMERLPDNAILIIASDTFKFEQGDFPKELESQEVLNFTPEWRIAVWKK